MCTIGRDRDLRFEGFRIFLQSVLHLQPAELLKEGDDMAWLSCYKVKAWGHSQSSMKIEQWSLLMAVRKWVNNSQSASERQKCRATTEIHSGFPDFYKKKVKIIRVSVMEISLTDMLHLSSMLPCNLSRHCCYYWIFSRMCQSCSLCASRVLLSHSKVARDVSLISVG